MIKQNRLIKEHIDILVTEEEETYTGVLEVDKNGHQIIGVLFTADRDDMLLMRGMFKLTINDEEFFPENTETKLLQCGLNIEPNKRMFFFDPPVEPGNRKVEVKLTDTSNAGMDFAPYHVHLYVFSKLKEDSQ
jgi:hypothetical protein